MIDNFSWITVYPEIVLLTLACVIALVDLGVKSAGRTTTYVLTVATLALVAVMQAEYDAKNPAALARLLKNGVKLRTFSPEIMDASYKSAVAVMDEEAAKNAKFKKVYEPWKRFRQDQNQWYSVGESPIQSYLIAKK